MADTLAIHDLLVSCRLGVFEWEREQPQEIRVDVELEIDAAAAAKHDDVRQTVDYAALAGAIAELAQRRSFRLMETLAHAIATMMLEWGATKAVQVRVKKQALAGIGYAAVTVERRRRMARRVARARVVAPGRLPAARAAGPR